MGEQLYRRDAWAGLDQGTAADRRILHLLIRLPFLWAEAIAALNGLAGPGSVYRSLKGDCILLGQVRGEVSAGVWARPARSRRR